MKRNVFILLLFMAFFRTDAQNLVPNYSFEDTIKCPNAYFYFQGYISNWAGIEPGYFSPYCSDLPYGGMPLNKFGFQYAHTGEAYIGIYTFLKTDTGSSNYTLYHNARDYIQDSLLSPLIAGVKYYVAFYVSLADSEKYACNNIGAYFSDSSLNLNRYVKSGLYPQITNNPISNALISKSNWIKVSGSFKAQGGEQYIIIGNFTDDAHSDTVFENSSANYADFFAAYYFVDDVMVTTDSNYADSLYPTSVQNINARKEVVQVYPNPSNTVLTIQFSTAPQQAEHLYLYNLMGEQVESVQLKQSATSVSVAELPAGIYLYRVLDVDEVQVQEDKIMVVH